MVGVRWVKVRKGIREAPKVRCRLIAQESAGSEARDDLFAGTPPLAAMRYVLSEAASRGIRISRQRKIKVIDVKNVFLHGGIRRSVHRELPPADEHNGGGARGRETQGSDAWNERCTS